jgi:hypothetical protein
MMLHASTVLTVLLAWHRFQSADQPVEYFVTWKYINPTVSAFKSTAVAVLLGVCLGLPLFWEPSIDSESLITFKRFNNTHVVLVRLIFLELIYLKVKHFFLFDG